jgi:hypothetical protein
VDTVAENPMKKVAGSIAAGRGSRNSRSARAAQASIASAPDTAPQLRYGRHFGLLTAAAAGAAAARLAGLWPAVAFAYAGFGALHAASLAASVRRMPGRRRALGFVAASSILSAAVAILGLRAAPLVGGRSITRALLVVAACAFLGAVGYGLLLRMVLRYRLALAPLAATALACALAVYAAFEVTRRYPASGSFGLAVSWWLAFSAGLYVTDRRRTRP